MPKGLLIALEGIDGTGITTQAARVAAWLGGKGPTVLTKEPTDSPIGLLIREALQGDVPGLPEEAMALLFAADRRHHATSVLLPALERGDSVVVDRYLLSTYAYQSLDVDLAWLKELNTGAPRPDLTLLLTVDPATSARRILERKVTERYEGGNHLKAVLANYRRLAETLGEELRVRVVEGEGTEDAVFDRLTALIAPLLG